ncbi:hypothetical protein WJX73_008688 [Symbiochloris irregularis]|uniref:NAD(P)H dehydrogenase (quinone) n=1 Tax=Symbiochloris irregularis TaxID=706552 RepID=A0AAW1NRY5_9CHLO
MTDYSPDTISPTTPRVGVIAGSTRPGANSEALTQWVHELCVSRNTCDYELISLRDWNLPLLDEPGVPAHTGPTLPHTKAWSNKVSSFQGFVFVTPQYNWGYPAPLKNALDYLFKEWNGKPALVVTFGGRGGGKCAAQLKEGTFALFGAMLCCQPLIRDSIGSG